MTGEKGSGPIDDFLASLGESEEQFLLGPIDVDRGDFNAQIRDIHAKEEGNSKEKITINFSRWLKSALPSLGTALRLKKLSQFEEFMLRSLGADDALDLMRVLDKIKKKKIDWESFSDVQRQFDDFNTDFLLSRDVLFHISSPDGYASRESAELWGCFCHALQVLQLSHYPVGEKELSVCIVENIEPSADVQLCMEFSPATKRVIFDIGRPFRDIPNARKSRDMPTQVIQASPRNQAVYDLLHYADSHYPKDEALLSAYCSNALTEEVRHGIDYLSSDTGDVLLREDPDSHLDKMLMTNSDPFLKEAVTEVSGQMTAAAVSPDPFLRLREWKVYLHSLAPDQKKTAIYYACAACSVVLLANQLQLSGSDQLPELDSIFVKLSNPNSGKFYVGSSTAKLSACLDQLLLLPPATLRLALKAVYSQEFQTEIDVDPFPKIDETGSLVSKPLGIEIPLLKKSFGENTPQGLV
jgi:hypothetical protein